MNKEDNKKDQDKVLSLEELEHISGGIIVHSSSKRTGGYRGPDNSTLEDPRVLSK